MVAGEGPDAPNGLWGGIARRAHRRRSALLLGRGGARRRIASGQTDRRSTAFARRLRFQIALERIRQRDAQPLLYGVACAVTALLLFAATPARASLPPDGDIREAIATPARFCICAIRYDSLGEFPQWTAMLRRADAEIKNARTICRAGEMQERSLGGQIERANTALNRQAYISTGQNRHRAMYWEAPFAFLHGGRPCQDYVIAKYGRPHHADLRGALMRRVVLQAANGGEDHNVRAPALPTSATNRVAIGYR